MKDIPLLRAIVEASCLDDKELRFVVLTELQKNDLLNELERAQRMVLSGELLGVRIEVSDD